MMVLMQDEHQVTDNHSCTGPDNGYMAYTLYASCLLQLLQAVWSDGLSLYE